MEVILKKNVDKLGYANDDIVTVKPGYGRNFLDPSGICCSSDCFSKEGTRGNREQQRAHKEVKD